MIYAVVFLASLILIHFGTKQKKPVLKGVIIAIGLLLPCVLAGLRATTVGTDTSGYVLDYYNVASSSDSFGSFAEVINIKYNSNDLLYMLLSFFFGKAGIPFHFLLFVIECLVVFPVYFSLKKFGFKGRELVFGMLFFYLAFYNLSLNMVRQSVALSLSVLGFSFLVNGAGRRTWLKYLLSIALLLIAVGFHDTAAIVALVYVLYIFYAAKIIPKKAKNIVTPILLAASFIGLMLYKPILSFIGSTGIYPKAITYLNKYSMFDINYLGTILNVGIIALVVANKKLFIKRKVNYTFLFVLAIENAIIGFLGSFVMYAGRIAYYSLALLLIGYVPLLGGELSMKREKRNLKQVGFALLCIFMIVQWLVVIIINNSNNTMPYALGV